MAASNQKSMNSLIGIGLTAVLAILLGISYRVYRVAFEEVQARQGAQQLEMAKSAALGIQYFLRHVADDLKLVAETISRKPGDPANLHSEMRAFFRHAERNTVRSLFIFSHKKQPLQILGETLPDAAKTAVIERIDAPPSKNGAVNNVWVSPVFAGNGEHSNDGLAFVVLVRLPRDESGAPDETGVVGYLMNFEDLMQEFVEPIKFGKTGFAWVMDAGGRLLHHPRHPEMILRSVHETKPDCQQCHTSFEKQRALVRKSNQYQIYQVANEPTKIMAQADVLLANEKWIMVVALDLAEITASTRKNFQALFWLVGLIIASLLVAGAWLMRLSIRRTRAEEVARHSEEKRLIQEKISHAAKLASLGQLVDSVAHEINTPVGIISAQVDAAMIETGKEPDYETYNIIKDQTRRMSKYTRNLLRFSRPAYFQPTWTPLAELLEECTTLLGHRLRAAKIQLVKKWLDDGALVQVDRDQMQQVIINLLNNAIEAVSSPGGGIEMTVNKTGAAGKSGFEIIVSDNGPGIASENLKKIFEPFFSTKTVERGTGLGLSIARTIIKQHDGEIDVASEPGAGASFRIFLPASQEA